MPNSGGFAALRWHLSRGGVQIIAAQPAAVAQSFFSLRHIGSGRQAAELLIKCPQYATDFHTERYAPGLRITGLTEGVRIRALQARKLRVTVAYSLKVTVLDKASGWL